MTLETALLPLNRLVQDWVSTLVERATVGEDRSCWPLEGCLAEG